MKVEEVIKHLKERIDKYKVIAFDGRCASGKSTAAAELERAGYALIHTDDFFLPASLRTTKRLKAPGGNFHFERFIDEVIIPLKNNQDISYGIFDCGKMDIIAYKCIKKGTPIIVEGAYALHPTLGNYYDEAYFFDISKKEQLRRLETRSPERLDAFIKKWIPMEEQYIKHYKINKLEGLVTVADQ